MREPSWKGRLSNFCQKSHDDPFENFKGEKAQDGAQVERAANRGDQTAEDVEVGIGVKPSKTHDRMMDKAGEPGANKPREQKNCIDEEDPVDDFCE